MAGKPDYKKDKLARFYLKHTIREDLILVNYDFDSAKFLEMKEFLYEEYGEEFVRILMAEIIDNVIRGMNEGLDT